MVAPLLGLRQWFVPLSFALNPVAIELALGDMVHFRCQGRKVDAGFDLGQRVAQLEEHMIMMLVGKQVSLDGATLLHGGQVSDQVATILLGQGQARLFRGTR